MQNLLKNLLSKFVIDDVILQPSKWLKPISKLKTLNLNNAEIHKVLHDAIYLYPKKHDGLKAVDAIDRLLEEDGFLLGEHRTKICNQISDARHDGVELEKEIILHTAIQNSKSFSFYDNLGDVFEKQLKVIFKTQAEVVVGIYFIRKNTRSSLSLREKSIIKNMLHTDFFCHKFLLVLLFTPHYESNKATHVFAYKSFICTENGIVPVSTDIINLGNLEMRNYALKSRLLGSESNPRSQYLKLLQEEFRDRFFSKTGSVALADNTYSLMYRTLFSMKELQEQIQSSETSILELEELLNKSIQDE